MIEIRTLKALSILVILTLTALPGLAYATAFTSIGIGDIDGFGFGTGAGLINANGDPVNVDGLGLLWDGDFLPDLDGGGTVATGAGDDFDNRSAAEAAGTALLGSGYTNDGTTGSQWTDISLSTSYSLGNFPDSSPSVLPNQPGFVFDFFVADADIVTNSSLYFNLVFGDYDVYPANIRYTFSSSPQITQPLDLQAGNEDGLIQVAFAELNFADVFTATTGGWDGYLEVDFLAGNEPYTAFDYVELSLNELTTPPPVPEPASLTLLGAGIFGLLARRRIFG